VEEIWNKLIAEGESMMPLDTYPFSPKYGWVQDKYGVSWQLYTARDENHIVQKIVPTLMFTGSQNGRATEAAQLYTSLFPNSAMRGIMYYDAASGEPETSVQHGEFFINNYLLMMMDSSLEHKFNFSEGLSLVIECNDQEEIDDYWNALTSNGGKEGRCGWLKDRFGISWQIAPSQLDEWMKKSPKVMDEVMKMKKPDINILRAAAESATP
ncbi:MAG: VOC family protein, partial [Petrimonas sp.]|nr:VOC family protein [Petrimonas sp.]